MDQAQTSQGLLRYPSKVSERTALLCLAAEQCVVKEPFRHGKSFFPLFPVANHTQIKFNPESNTTDTIFFFRLNTIQLNFKI